MARWSEDLSPDSETWRAYRHMKADERADRRGRNTVSIMALAEAGYSVQRLTDYQFRINDRLDLFPTNRRWHDIAVNKRGRFSDPLSIARDVLGMPVGVKRETA